MDAKNAEEEQLKEKIISFEVQIQENEKQNLKLVDELKVKSYAISYLSRSCLACYMCGMKLLLEVIPSLVLLLD